MTRKPNSADRSSLFESLEARQLLATFTVQNINDSGVGSLRQAVVDANALPGADVIEFNELLAGTTIGLTSGELGITDDLTINGLGSSQLTVSGSGVSRVMSAFFANTDISGLTITGGNGVGLGSGTGGGLANFGFDRTMRLDDVTVEANITSDPQGGGGGIYTTGTLVVSNSLVQSNGTPGGGGGILTSGGPVSLVDTQVIGNGSGTAGGGIRVLGAGTSLDVTRSLFSGNVANLGGGGISAGSGPMSIFDSVITGNSTPASGGGIEFNASGFTGTISATTISQNTASINGGGVLAFQGTLNIEDSTISGNAAAGDGGGIYNEAFNSNASVALTDSTISDNSATNGGGIHVNLGQVSLVDSEVVSNATTGDGGGIYNASTLLLTRASVKTNTSAGSGGGIANYDANAQAFVSDSEVSGNEASRPNASGGGIYTRGSLSVSGSTVSDNEAGFGGGGVYGFTGSAITISSSVITENSADSRGGGLDVTGSLSLSNSTVSGNSTAGHAGGILNLGTATILNSTISMNTAASTAGGIENVGTLTLTGSTVSGNASQATAGGIFAGGDVTINSSTIAFNTSASTGSGGINSAGTRPLLNNTLLGGNTAGGTPNDVFGAVDASSSYNLIQASSSSGLTDGVNGNILGEDPLLSPLASNGGRTQTHAIDAASPALNAGLSSLLTDQRGDPFSRAFDGAPDIGAYERQSLALTVDNLIDESDGNYLPGDLSLREAIELSNANPLPDEIRFDAATNGGTITLGGTELSIADTVQIIGNGADQLTVSGSTTSRIAHIETSALSVSISGLTLTGGNGAGADSDAANVGGAIYNKASLILANITISGNTSDYAGGVFSDNGTTLSLDGVTVSNNTVGFHGGGIAVDEATVTITNSTISNNAAGEGGGIYNDDGLITITGTVIRDNSASGNGFGAVGGGIRSNGTLNIVNSTISDNSASDGGTGGQGGGIYSLDTTTITDSSVSQNYSAGRGGGIASYDETISLTRTTVYDNAAANGEGGGIYHDGPSLTITDSPITSNFSFGSGGGIYSSGLLTISGSDVSDNMTEGDGGGIYFSSGTLTLGTSTVNRNQATGNSGGGIFVSGGINTITDSTISSNTARYDAGGIFNSSTLTITDSAVTQNTAESFGGGGIRTTVDLTLVRTNVADNDGARFGGGILQSGSLTVTDSTISGNTATEQGGGIDSNSTLTITGSTISGNSGGNGGGVYFGDTTDTLAITDSTVSGNAATGNGGGIYRGSGTLTITDSTIADNTATGFGGGALGGGTITNSTISGNSAGENGGGLSGTFTVIDSMIMNNSATVNGGGTVGDLTMSGSTVSGNTAGADGGGIYAAGVLLNVASIEVTDSQITGNTAGGFGGGIMISIGTLTLSDSTVSGNTAETGGGVSGSVSTVTLTGSTVSTNTATDSGGGVGMFGTLELTESVVSDNVATGSGGGIDSSGGVVRLETSTVSGNRAGTDGGGIRHAGELSIVRSTVSGNTADGDGGGVRSAPGGMLTVTNSTISGNSAGGSGGGIAVADSPVAISNSTIAYNVADANDDGAGMGGGIILESADAELTTTSTIYSNNTRGTASPAGDDISATGAPVTGSYNLVGDASTSGGLTHGVDNNIVGQDAMLHPLALNGGTTQTHALRPVSPAIDAGFNGENLATDQRGRDRTRGDFPDIGAFEATVRPTLDALTVSASEFAQGDSVTLTASGAADADGTVREVRFYLDRNGDGVADPDELLGTDTDGSDGYSITLDRTQTAALSLGTATFIAEAVDNEFFTSTPRSAAANVLYSLRARPGALVSGSSTSDDALWTGIVNDTGDVVIFESSSNLAFNLSLETGAPKAIGNLIVYTDPIDGIAYAVYPSADGLILAHRDPTQGTWSFRNLSVELGVSADSPTGRMTQFVSRGDIVFVAGYTASNELVLFQKATSGEWTFKNLSDDLASQGMTTPDLVEITSYVTPWDQWTIAGIDSSGQIQGVWVFVNSFKTWRTDNLSALFGAPSLTGQLTVIQTPWSAINLSGSDADGNLITTWWIPRFKGSWRVNNLTAEQNGTPLSNGRISGFITPWGAMNYAGINAQGEVFVYWWLPATKWQVASLTGNIDANEARPTGTLTNHVSGIGTMNVLGTADDGNAQRLWWKPDGERWRLTDLTETATRA